MNRPTSKNKAIENKAPFSELSNLDWNAIEAAGIEVYDAVGNKLAPVGGAK